MILKVADAGQGQGFRLIEVRDVTFGHGRDQGGPFSYADVTTETGTDRVLVKGTAYVLNSAGDTIEKFSERQERKG